MTPPGTPWRHCPPTQILANLPFLCPAESDGIVDCLSRRDPPPRPTTSAIVAAIPSGPIRWFEPLGGQVCPRKVVSRDAPQCLSQICTSRPSTIDLATQRMLPSHCLFSPPLPQRGLLRAGSPPPSPGSCPCRGLKSKMRDQDIRAVIDGDPRATTMRLLTPALLAIASQLRRPSKHRCALSMVESLNLP
jgi:hypothetical protein